MFFKMQNCKIPLNKNLPNGGSLWPSELYVSGTPRRGVVGGGDPLAQICLQTLIHLFRVNRFLQLSGQLGVQGSITGVKCWYWVGLTRGRCEAKMEENGRVQGEDLHFRNINVIKCSIIYLCY